MPELISVIFRCAGEASCSSTMRTDSTLRPDDATVSERTRGNRRQNRRGGVRLVMSVDQPA